MAPAMFDRLFRATEEMHRGVKSLVEERSAGNWDEEVKRLRAEGMDEGCKRCP